MENEQRKAARRLIKGLQRAHEPQLKNPNRIMKVPFLKPTA